jgi:RNA-directed DNA polymerase
VVWEAFKRVKANQGSAGVDRQSIAGFEADLSNNLYKLWNRMCSGSYFPPPVRRVEIPKADGGVRPLGIPTVADRIAQEVARRYLRPRLEPVFHADSYGYRPGRSAIDAVRTARQRCWRYDWVLDIDVKGYFDSIDWELLLKAVRHLTDCRWVLLYIERWLKAPVQMEDGSIVPRTAGTPQGGVISPLLANLFLHYAFDMWMARTYPHIPFERYADDIICHCKSAEEARALWGALADRFAACKLVPQSRFSTLIRRINARRSAPISDALPGSGISSAKSGIKVHRRASLYGYDDECLSLVACLAFERAAFDARAFIGSISLIEVSPPHGGYCELHAWPTRLFNIAQTPRARPCLMCTTPDPQ